MDKHWVRQAQAWLRSSGEGERKFKGTPFERTILTPAKVSPLTRQMHPAALNVFEDSHKAPETPKASLEFWSRPYDNSFNTPAMPLDEAHSGGFFSSRIC